MPDLTFGEWLPDRPDLDNPGLTECKNVTPKNGYYEPFPGAQTYSTALAEAGSGAWSGYIANQFLIFVGTQTKIYKLATETPVDVSRAAGYTTPGDLRWEFELHGTILIATNGNSPIQGYNLSSDTLFSDFISSASPPTARHIAVAKTFLILGNVIDSSSVHYRQRVWWSSINDPDNFPTPGGVEANATQSSYNDLNDSSGGDLRALFGGSDITIFLEHAIWKALYIGGNFVWQFEKIADNVGLFVEYCAKRIGETIYFLDENGFFSLSGNRVTPIGYEKVNAYFWANVSSSYIYATHCFVDIANNLVGWAYVDANSGSTTQDRALIYNINTGQWARIHMSTPLMFYAGTVGYNLDNMDSFGNVDYLGIPLDSRFWAGGVGVLAGVDTSNQVVFYTGSALSGQIDSGEVELARGKRSLITGVRPAITGSGTTTVQIGSRALQTGSISYTSAFTVNANTGWHNMRREGRYHRVRINTTGAFTKLLGVDLDFVEGGER